MSKMKTHRGARKRFSVTAEGFVRHKQSNKRHKLGKKAAKRKRRLDIPGVLGKGDTRRVRLLLPNQ